MAASSEGIRSSPLSLAVCNGSPNTQQNRPTFTPHSRTYLPNPPPLSSQTPCLLSFCQQQRLLEISGEFSGERTEKWFKGCASIFVQGGQSTLCFCGSSLKQGNPWRWSHLIRPPLRALEWQEWGAKGHARAKSYEHVLHTQVLPASVDCFKALSGIVGKHNFVIVGNWNFEI